MSTSVKRRACFPVWCAVLCSRMIDVYVLILLLCAYTGVGAGDLCDSEIVNFNVSTPAEALNLSESLHINCTNAQQFIVDWVGNVQIQEPFNVTWGRALTIRRSSTDEAVIDGGLDTQLFVLDEDAIVVLENLVLTRGRATSTGAAVHASARSKLNAYNCTFKDNVASEGGGEMHARAPTGTH